MQAAIRAGYSEKTAAVIGAENLIKPNVQEAIALAQESAQQSAQQSAQDFNGTQTGTQGNRLFLVRTC